MHLCSVQVLFFTNLTSAAYNAYQGFVISTEPFDGILKTLSKEHGSTLDTHRNSTQSFLVIPRCLSVHRIQNVTLTNLK